MSARISALLGMAVVFERSLGSIGIPCLGSGVFERSKSRLLLCSCLVLRCPRVKKTREKNHITIGSNMNC